MNRNKSNPGLKGNIELVSRGLGYLIKNLKFIFNIVVIIFVKLGIIYLFQNYEISKLLSYPLIAIYLFLIIPAVIHYSNLLTCVAMQVFSSIRGLYRGFTGVLKVKDQKRVGTMFVMKIIVLSITFLVHAYVLFPLWKENNFAEAFSNMIETQNASVETNSPSTRKK